jgi:hypothetical protein
MTIDGFPTLTIFNNEKFYNELTSDYREKSHAEAHNLLLTYIYKALREEGKNSIDYGLPLPKEHISELDEAKMQHSASYEMKVLQQLQNESPNNVEQQIIFDEITIEFSLNDSPNTLTKYKLQEMKQLKS